MRVVGSSYLKAGDYSVFLRALAQANSSWVMLHEDLSRGQLAELGGPPEGVRRR